MTIFQRASKLGVIPAVATTTVAATSSLLGQKSSTYATSRITSVTSKNLPINARGHFFVAKSKWPCEAPPSLNQQLRQHYPYSTKIQCRHESNATTTTTPATPAVETLKVPEGQAAAAKIEGGGFLTWYENNLQARPVVTKMVTGSFLWGLGDAVAQVVPTLFFDDNANDDADKSGASSSENTNFQQQLKGFDYDYERTARAVLFGFAIHAPTSHVHYNFLEWMTVRAGFTGLSIPVFKAFMEQFVYWSWFSNSLYHGAMGAMQGLTPQQIYDRIADVLWDTQKAQWVFWIPVQLLNFRFVPVRHQLNVVLLTSVVWTALLSAWYPPEKKTDTIESASKDKM